MEVQSAKPNTYQDNVIDFFQNGTGHAVVKAVAGGGKTTLLLRMFDKLPAGKRLAYGVYNKANAAEAKEKTGFRPGIFIKTAHGFGCEAWKRAYPKVEIDEKKKWEMIATHLDLYTMIDDPATGKSRRVYKNSNIAETTKKLISFAKDQMFGMLVDPKKEANWQAIIDHHNLEMNFAVDGKLPVDIGAQLLESCRLAYKGLQYSIEIAKEIIDYGDMIYMPLIGKVHLWKYDFVFVDEAQDTNAARRELYKAMLKPNGRMIAVGDPHQAIYGFTGADADSLQIIIDEMKALSLPLSCSFRCPKAVVRVAQRYVSHIESHEDAPEGIARKIEAKDIYKQDLKPTDFIICRNTAPLVDLAYELIRRGIPCHIEGRDIGEGLIKLTKQWDSVKTVGAFIRKLNEYTTKQITKYMEAGQEAKAQVISDKCQTLNAIAEDVAGSAEIEVLQNKIAALFQDGNDKKQTLKLLTIHKSKGLEAERVFWYGANAYQPSPFAKQEWQIGQELNLCYVAATRAKYELVEVVVPVEKKRRGEY